MNAIRFDGGNIIIEPTKSRRFPDLENEDDHLQMNLVRVSDVATILGVNRHDMHSRMFSIFQA